MTEPLMPTKEIINDLAQAKKQLEQLVILLAWEAGELTEGQAARRLVLDRIDLRAMRQYWLSHA